MDLKGLKREVEALPNIKEKVEKVKLDFLMPLQSPSFLEGLNSGKRIEVKEKLAIFRKQLEEVSLGQGIHERLREQARYLVDLKLTTFNGDKEKAKMLTNQLLHDDLFNFQQALDDIKQWEKQLANLFQQYYGVTELLQNNLSLEYSIQLLESPHQQTIKDLLTISKKQRELVQGLGREFVEMAKSSKKSNY